MAELRIVPTFHLRGIQPQQILAQYKNNVFPSFPTEKVSLTTTKINILPKLDTDQSQENFLFLDKSGSKIVCTSTNQSSYETWTERKTCDPEALCNWCRFKVGEKGIPLPISIFGNDLYIGDVPYCSYECCFAGYKRDHGRSFQSIDPIYRKTEQILRYLFSLDYPEETLREAMDWRLLDINGGPLSREQFTKGMHFSKTMHLIVPVKMCYTQILNY